MGKTVVRRSVDRSGRYAALRIVVVCALFAGAWVMLSDYALVLLFKDPALVVHLSVAKGMFFVLVTCLLLYPLFRGYIRQTKGKEDALQQGEARFRSYVEHAPVAVVVVDRDGQLRDFNPAAIELLGFDAEALRNLRARDLVINKDTSAVQNDLQSLFAGTPVESEYSFTGGTAASGRSPSAR